MKKKIIALVLIMSVLGAAALVIYSDVQKKSLLKRYPGMEWEEKAQLYEKFILRSEILPEYHVNLKIIADIPLKTHQNLKGKNNPSEIRLLFSYDYRRNHYLAYASASWRSNKILIEPLHRRLREDSAPALVLHTRSFAPYGEDVYCLEVFDPEMVSMKIYILAGSDTSPVYLSINRDLQNGGFMIEEPVARAWLRDKNNLLHEIK